MSSHSAPLRVYPRGKVDLARSRGLGRFLRWRHARTMLQIPLLLISILIIFDGLAGPSLAPKNLAGVLPWVHWRGLVVLALLIVGNLFCMACPFMLPRRLAKRVLPAGRAWPTWLPGKWLALGLLLAFFWAYEAFDIWASPWLTAWVALAYFAGAFVVDGFFKGAAFCKHVCPIGQFNFVNSLVSPFEVGIRDANTCASCVTKDCISGRKNAAGQVTQNGCELWLFQERKVGNMDCTFCLDCLHACPHDNVGVLLRNPVSDLASGARRSGIGRIEERWDLALLVLALTFGAFINAFGMIAPVYELLDWLSGALGVTSEPVLVALLFLTLLVALPLALVSYTAWFSRRLAGGDQPLRALISRYSLALAPLGFAMWLAHYGFHFFTGALTIVPLTQSFLGDLGIGGLGVPRWELAELLPVTWVDWFELLALEAGLLGSLWAAHRISRALYRSRRLARRAAIPWFVLSIVLFGLGVWLMTQPMEMRGTGLS